MSEYSGHKISGGNGCNGLKLRPHWHVSKTVYPEIMAAVKTYNK